MQLYYAPMEGLTSCLYRQVHARMFPGLDRYYAPFLAPDSLGNCRTRELKELLPEHNAGIELIPQLLCAAPGPFLAAAEQLRDMGYTRVNLNAGCPSGTVVPKHKGAGMLADLQALDAFLDQVFSRCPMEVSVKTRLGLESTEEFEAILEVYNRYPLSELIIHARDRAGMYKSVPDHAAFTHAFQRSRCPVCYNGNLFAPGDLDAVSRENPGLERFMLGRGLAADPALGRRIRGGDALHLSELREFLTQLRETMLAAGLSEHHCLARLKELWYYLIALFPDSRRGAKAINKAQKLSDYRQAVEALLREGSFDPESGFRG